MDEISVIVERMLKGVQWLEGPASARQERISAAVDTQAFDDVEPAGANGGLSIVISESELRRDHAMTPTPERIAVTGEDHPTEYG